jgi:hypothetical protein
MWDFARLVMNIDVDVDLHSIILVKFTNSLVRSRPLKEIGAEQVSLTYMAYLFVGTQPFASATYRFANHQGIFGQNARRRLGIYFVRQSC